MNPYEKLRRSLEEKDVLMGAIRINETPSDSTYCILNYGDEIETFYSERGAKYDLKTFSDEAAAITYFEEWVLSNQTLRKGWNGFVR